MSVSVIAAVSDNGVIGHRGQLPWRLPEDLKRFKALTMGHTLVMGRATYDSIGRPLPGRRTIVITRQISWCAQGVDVAHSVDEALLMAGRGEVFVVGGGEIYRETLGRSDVLYLTYVSGTFEGDAYFPPFDQAAFREVFREEHPEAPLPFTFVTYARASSSQTPVPAY